MNNNYFNINNVLKLTLIFILISASLSIMYYNNDTKLKVALVTGTVAILFLIENRNIIEENFSAPFEYKVGPYDNLKLKPNGCSDWRHPPACNKLYNWEKIYTPQGTPFPLNPAISKEGTKNGPNVDGTEKTPNDMFMFAYNKVSLDCCPSTYSTDRGCVCTTKQQRDFINSRGNNRNYNNTSGITNIDA